MLFVKKDHVLFCQGFQKLLIFASAQLKSPVHTAQIFKSFLRLPHFPGSEKAEIVQQSIIVNSLFLIGIGISKQAVFDTSDGIFIVPLLNKRKCHKCIKGSSFIGVAFIDFIHLAMPDTLSLFFKFFVKKHLKILVQIHHEFMSFCVTVIQQEERKVFQLIESLTDSFFFGKFCNDFFSLSELTIYKMFVGFLTAFFHLCQLRFGFVNKFPLVALTTCQNEKN